MSPNSQHLHHEQSSQTQGAELAASELRASIAAENQAATARAATSWHKREEPPSMEQNGARELPAGGGATRIETLATLTLAERRHELVVRAAVTRQAAERAAEAASWARHVAAEEAVCSLGLV